MKKISAVIVAAVLLLATGCGVSDQKDNDKESDYQDVSVEQTEGDVKIESIEDVMYTLSDEGFSKTDEGYVWINHEDDVDSKYILKARENTLYFEGHMDFGKDNSFMAEDFKSGAGSVESIPANYLVSLANYGGNHDASVKYVIYVGDSKVAEGEMSYKEADKIVSDIDD